LCVGFYLFLVTFQGARQWKSRTATTGRLHL
jgi:hypothetical protein